MVKDTRTAVGDGDLRALNRPHPIPVETDDDGTPAALKLRGRWLAVESVVDRWRIDDEWWRDRATSREYYKVVLEDGRNVVLFMDLASYGWYSHH